MASSWFAALGGEAAFVADGGRQAAPVQALLERVEHLGTIAQGLGEARRAHRDDHELLHVEVVVGMRAAIDDVHHRHRQVQRPDTAQVAVQRQAGFLGGRLGHRQRHGQWHRRPGAICSRCRPDRSACGPGRPARPPPGP